MRTKRRRLSRSRVALSRVEVVREMMKPDPVLPLLPRATKAPVGVKVWYVTYQQSDVPEGPFFSSYGKAAAYAAARARGANVPWGDLYKVEWRKVIA